MSVTQRILARLLGVCGVAMLAAHVLRWLPLLAISYGALIILCLWWGAVLVMLKGLLLARMRYRPWVLGVCGSWLLFQLLSWGGMATGLLHAEGSFDWQHYYHWTDAYWPLTALAVAWTCPAKNNPVQ